jgi:hypothetical protein
MLIVPVVQLRQRLMGWIKIHWLLQETISLAKKNTAQIQKHGKIYSNQTEP